MSDGVAAERADDLIALAKASGFHVTKTQLARWHRAGLLPRPVRRQGLGRGKGTISIYPAGTGTQLLALLVIRTRERRLPFIAWSLWWSGYSVPTRQIRSYLQRIVAGYERALQEFIKDGALTKSGEALLEDAERTRGPKHFARARKRLGKKLFHRFMFLMLEVLSGTFERWEQSGDDPEIIERGLGFTLRARTIRARRRKLPLQPWTAASIRELSQSFRPSAFRHYVESATDDDLERARNEVRSLLGLLTGFGAVFGRRAPLLTLFQDLDSTTPLGGAMFVMLWLAFRHRGPALQTLQVLQMLAAKIPAVADLLTPEQLAVALRSRDALEKFENSLSERLAEHRDEIDAFLQRFPEVREVFDYIRISSS